MIVAAEERTATVDGIPMRWIEAGAGPPVVLVHGIPTSPALWRHVLPKIAGARLLAWEMVGYGAADPFQKVRYGRRLAADLDAEMTEIEGGKHFVPEDHPDEIAAAVEAVLREAETD